jgi:hypothetical protein
MFIFVPKHLRNRPYISTLERFRHKIGRHGDNRFPLRTGSPSAFCGAVFAAFEFQVFIPVLFRHRLSVALIQERVFFPLTNAVVISYSVNNFRNVKGLAPTKDPSFGVTQQIAHQRLLPLHADEGSAGQSRRSWPRGALLGGVGQFVRQQRIPAGTTGPVLTSTDEHVGTNREGPRQQRVVEPISLGVTWILTPLRSAPDTCSTRSRMPPGTTRPPPRACSIACATTGSTAPPAAPCMPWTASGAHWTDGAIACLATRSASRSQWSSAPRQLLLSNQADPVRRASPTSDSGRATATCHPIGPLRRPGP